MIWSSNVQNLNLRFLIFWAVQKWQTLTDCEISKICTVHYCRSQNLLFLHSSNYKVFWLENLHDCKSQHCMFVYLISDFFETLEWYFWFFPKTSYSLRSEITVAHLVQTFLWRVDLLHTWVRTHPLSNFYSRYINPFLVCFPSRARDSGVQKWFQNFDLIFFIKVNSKIDFSLTFCFLGWLWPKKFIQKIWNHFYTAVFRVLLENLAKID
jgi:hypothetical protein